LGLMQPPSPARVVVFAVIVQFRAWVNGIRRRPLSRWGR
jgi:hypothetical protein